MAEMSNKAFAVWAVVFGVMIAVGVSLCFGIFILGATGMQDYRKTCAVYCTETADVDHCRSERWSRWTMQRVCGPKKK